MRPASNLECFRASALQMGLVNLNRKRSSVHRFVASALLVAVATAALADPVLDTLVAAYPDHLAGYDETALIWRDGTRMPVSDGRAHKTFDELLERPDIRDQFSIAYPLGIDLKTPALNEDPGRIRNEAFFLKMYGDCRKGAVAGKLKSVAWLSGRGSSSLMATTVNGVADRLAAVSRDLAQQPPDMAQYL